MSKKMKVLVSVLVAVLVLVVGGTAMVMAQEGEEEPTPQAEANGLLARVAEILDIPEEDLIDAFKQARQEIREEVFYQALDKAVEEGLVTRDEAEEIKEWWEQKPEVLDRGLLRRAFGFMAQRGGHMPENRLGVQARISQQPWQEMRQERQEMRQETCTRFLGKAVEEGYLTQDEAGELKEWRENRLRASDRLSSRARVFKAIRGRQMVAAPG